MSLREERGFTLIETLVTLSIMSIVMVIAFEMLIHVTNISNRAINDVNTENNARLVLRAVTEDIRAAKPSTITFTGSTSICPATPTPGTCLHFTIARDTVANEACQSVITYGFLGTALKESRTDSGCAQNISFPNKTVIDNVLNGSTDIFAYFDKSGNPLTSGQAASGSIGVTLLLRYQKNAPTLTVTSYASLRNAR